MIELMIDVKELGNENTLCRTKIPLNCARVLSNTCAVNTQLHICR